MNSVENKIKPKKQLQMNKQLSTEKGNTTFQRCSHRRPAGVLGAAPEPGLRAHDDLQRAHERVAAGARHRSCGR